MVDERGEIVSPSVLTALIAVRELGREPGATIIHNLITSRAVPEIVTEHGGVPVRTRVGHSFIKAQMAADGRDLRRRALRPLLLPGLLVRRLRHAGRAARAGRARDRRTGPLSELLAEYSRYVASGEINSEVSDQAAATEQVRAAFAGRPGVSTDELDGLTVTGPDWWFNLRPSNTEPLLRLNVEAPDAATLAAVRDEVLRYRALRRLDKGDAVKIDDWLLDILACPKCHSPLRADAAAERAGLHRRGLRSGLPGARRHPRPADRRGAANRRVSADQH